MRGLVLWLLFIVGLVFAGWVVVSVVKAVLVFFRLTKE